MKKEVPVVWLNGCPGYGEFGQHGKPGYEKFG
jgi:hypothetical protein